MSQTSKSPELDQSEKWEFSRRDFLETAGMTTLALGAGVFSLHPVAAKAIEAVTEEAEMANPIAAKQDNVLFILTDQERYLPELLGKGHWPGRDRLAEMGTVFENHQVCSMVCTPSRSVIFTGQHIQHTKMFDNTDFPWCENMSFEIPTIGHMMRDAGYYSTYQGKWHLHSRVHEHYQEGEPFQMIGHAEMEKYGFSDFTGIGDAVGDPLFGYYTDPHEMHNLVLAPENTEILLAMKDKLNSLIDAEVGRDDGSHLPDIEGVNWFFERFDP